MWYSILLIDFVILYNSLLGRAHGSVRSTRIQSNLEAKPKTEPSLFDCSKYLGHELTLLPSKPAEAPKFYVVTTRNIDINHEQKLARSSQN